MRGDVFHEIKKTIVWGLELTFHIHLCEYISINIYLHIYDIYIYIFIYIHISVAILAQVAAQVVDHAWIF